MKRIFLALVAFVLLSGPAFGHGLDNRGESGAQIVAAGSGPEAPAENRHRPDGSGGFHHCTVSASCAPVFVLSGGGALPFITSARTPWWIAGEALRRNPVLERDPPVPRA